MIIGTNFALEISSMKNKKCGVKGCVPVAGEPERTPERMQRGDMEHEV